jgi:hypothetical protein
MAAVDKRLVEFYSLIILCDKQPYRVQNSEAVREHEEHHVKVRARLLED